MISHVPRIYLASGWFNAEQIKQMNEVYDILCGFERNGQIQLFAPYYDGIVLKSSDPNLRKKMEIVFWLDTEMIKQTDMLIACTIDKDVGTIIECGYALAHEKSIVCYNSNPQHGLNVMLAHPAKGFCKDQTELYSCVNSMLEHFHNIETSLKTWKFNMFKGEPI